MLTGATRALCAGEDPVAAALEKIKGYIGSAKKFKKASPLLRQLLVEGKVTAAHSDLLFEVTTSFTVLDCIHPLPAHPCLHTRLLVEISLNLYCGKMPLSLVCRS